MRRWKLHTGNGDSRLMIPRKMGVGVHKVVAQLVQAVDSALLVPKDVVVFLLMIILAKTRLDMNSMKDPSLFHYSERSLIYLVVQGWTTLS